MSRNLCRPTCYYCDHVIQLLENPRPITEKDAWHFFKEFEGLIVARANCPKCLAKYLAWIDESKRVRHPYDKQYDGPVQDLSFLSTFNDEPGPSDLPLFKVEKRWVRTGDWDVR